MKKNIAIIFIVSSIFFVACGDKTKEAVESTQESVSTLSKKAAKTSEEAVTKVMDNAEIAAKEAKQKAEKIALEAKKVAEKAAEDAKTKAVELSKIAEEKANELAAAAKIKTASIIKTATDKVQATTKAVKAKIHAATAPTVDVSVAAPLYAKCAGCHGKDGKIKALGKSALLSGQDAATLTESMKGYRAGTRNVAGMGSLMKGQIGTMSDSDIEILAAYIETF